MIFSWTASDGTGHPWSRQEVQRLHRMLPGGQRGGPEHQEQERTDATGPVSRPQPV